MRILIDALLTGLFWLLFIGFILAIFSPKTFKTFKGGRVLQAVLLLIGFSVIGFIVWLIAAISGGGWSGTL